MKRINEHKLQAFTVGTMAVKRVSKKEQEEQKKKEDERAAAHVFQEFVETFQEAPSSINKVWVKAGTYDAGSRKEDSREKGKLYKPMSRLEERSSDKGDHGSSRSENIRSESSRSNDDRGKKRTSSEKKKSNLELFKEELRQMQEEREERHKYKGAARVMLHSNTETDTSAVSYRETEFAGSFDNGDPTTTNLYLGNLCPKITEQQLMELFGKYGPLASIKIMWPRSEEEKSRGRNCGFVAYMARRDAERALRQLNGRTVLGYEMKLGWGKSVPITSHPIYIPQALVEYLLPTQSGLPFNAQNATAEIDESDFQNYLDEPEARENVDKVLSNCLVKVVIPTERSLTALIHRMIEFVVREGPLFEAMIMSREVDNPAFRFLFDNKSPSHVYYRWKLFSLLQGDTITEWRQKEFRMFKGGSVWKPPVVNMYGQGMPEELVTEEDGGISKGQLSTAQRLRLEDLIRHLMPERSKIGEAMIFCIEHADAADEICECIAQSIESPGTLMHKKIARLYLISDILHNCSVKVQNASFFRKAFEAQLEGIVSDLHEYNKTIESRIKAAGFKARVMQVFAAWTEWAVYPKDFLALLKHIFLGGTPNLVTPSNVNSTGDVGKPDDIDGAPLSGDEREDEDLDGVPLDGAALLKSALARRDFAQGPVINSPGAKNRGFSKQSQPVINDDDDIDGVPLGEVDYDDDIDGVPLKEDDKHTSKNTRGFVPSKWETIAPDQVVAQAITTSKWDTLDHQGRESRKRSYDSSDDDENGSDSGGRDRGSSRHSTSSQRDSYDEDKRAKLREVELQMIRYQDELESGRTIRDGQTMASQLEQFRQRLMRKSLVELKSMSSGGGGDKEDRYNSDRRRSISPDEPRHRRRSPSPQYTKRNKRARSRSASPGASPDRYSSSSSSRKYRVDSPVGGGGRGHRSTDKYKYK